MHVDEKYSEILVQSLTPSVLAFGNLETNINHNLIIVKNINIDLN